MEQTRNTVARLLENLQGGDPAAPGELFTVLYAEIRKLARRQRARWQGNYTLNTTALVHEAYLKLVDQSRLSWENRSHFLAVYSLAMRNVLVDLARRRSARKRGGDRKRVELDESLVRIDEQADEILAINDALEKLAHRSPRLGRTVECRFFAGLSEEETARALQVSDRTVRRDWLKAKAFLYTLLYPEA
jgi:RNA polymerase sigma factor (TIGR02999 family)